MTASWPVVGKVSTMLALESVMYLLVAASLVVSMATHSITEAFPLNSVSLRSLEHHVLSGHGTVSTLADSS
jgi:hypothetical protein